MEPRLKVNNLSKQVLSYDYAMKNNRQAEEMASFFDQRARSYDAHMQQSLENAQVYYRKLAEPIKETKAAIDILDIGCGTGLEIPAILERVPNANITCIDLSRKMLQMLKEKFSWVSLKLVQASYLSFNFGRDQYDIALSSMTLHHLLPDEKRRLYEKILSALRPQSLYIEGDYVVREEKMESLLANYRVLSPEVKKGSHHIDIPLSLPKQFELLQVAGFSEIALIYSRGENVIISAKKTT